MIMSHPSPQDTPTAIAPSTLDRLRAELESALAAHQERLVRSPEQDDIAIAIHRRAQVGREEVLAALSRMNGGTYGNCQECSQPISEDRLDFMPHTKYCMHCARLVAANA